jgi:hypothetical protein
VLFTTKRHEWQLTPLCILRRSTPTGSHKLPHPRPKTPRRCLRKQRTLKEWRCYVECVAKIAIITRTLRHLPTQKSLGQRHAIWLNDLSPYLAINSRTNEHIMGKLYRKCSSNEADALFRCPELHHIVATAEQSQRLRNLKFEIKHSNTSKNRLESLGPPFCYAIHDLEA